LKNILLLLLVASAMMVGYQLQAWLKIRIDPYRSGKRLLLFFLINIIGLFSLVVITGFVIIYFKDFFFKK
jgi:hypothetical protein